MPKKGYKPGRIHRRHLAEGKRQFWDKVQALMQAEEDAARKKKIKKEKFTNPGANPVPTPRPPSAGYVSTPAFERWGLYSHTAEGKYYYKREQATTLEALKQAIKDLDLPHPLWTFVKSGQTEAECFMPIRIAEEAVSSLGHRFQQMKGGRKK